MRRVVVTGLGLICPLGCKVREVWKKLLAGESGIRRITSFDVEDLSARIAGQVPKGAGHFCEEDWISTKEIKKWIVSLFLRWQRPPKPYRMRAGAPRQKSNKNAQA